MKKILVCSIVMIFAVFCTFALLTTISSCTMSISNVDTHGTAQDVVDSTPTTDTKTDATIPIPGV